MRYLKLYENFSIGEDIWVLMDETEKYILGDVIRIDPPRAEIMASQNKKTPPRNKEYTIMIPTDDADMESIRQYSYKSSHAAMADMKYFKNLVIGYDHKDNDKVPVYRKMPYRTEEFTGKLKAVKLFMGVMKPDKLNI